MNISPRNQTLLLASERRDQGDRQPSATLGRVLDAASAGGVLKRLTIVAARPDDELVYVQADYATAADRADTLGSVVSPRALSTAVRATGGDLQPRTRAGLSSYLAPTEQYAQIQRNELGTRSLGLDVHA